MDTLSQSEKNFISRSVGRKLDKFDSEHKRTKQGNFEIDRDFIIQLLEKQNFRCAISGIRVKIANLSNFQMSIDRIDDNITYTKDNTRIIGLEFNTRVKWSHQMFSLLKEAQFLEFDIINLMKINQSIKNLYHSASGRNKDNPDLECTISSESLYSRWRLQQGKCYYSGALMKECGDRDFFQMSIERLNSTIGYTLENTVLICYCFQSSNCTINANEFTEIKGNGNWSITKYLYAQYVQEQRTRKEEFLDFKQFRKVENKNYLSDIENSKILETKQWIAEADWLKTDKKWEKEKNKSLHFLAYTDRNYNLWNQEPSSGIECEFYHSYDKDICYDDDDDYYYYNQVEEDYWNEDSDIHSENLKENRCAVGPGCEGCKENQRNYSYKRRESYY